MRHKPAHRTQGAAVSHALLFLVGAWNPLGALGRQIDDGSVQGRAADDHHDVGCGARIDAPYGVSENATPSR